MSRPPPQSITPAAEVTVDQVPLGTAADPVPAVTGVEVVATGAAVQLVVLAGGLTAGLVVAPDHVRRPRGPRSCRPHGHPGARRCARSPRCDRRGRGVCIVRTPSISGQPLWLALPNAGTAKAAIRMAATQRALLQAMRSHGAWLGRSSPALSATGSNRTNVRAVCGVAPTGRRSRAARGQRGRCRRARW